MIPPRMVLVLLAIAPLMVQAQPIAGDLPYLRNKASTEGWVEVVVRTKASIDASVAKIGELTADERRAIGRAQQKIMLILVSRGLVVGNEVSLQPDGSLVLRVLPRGLDVLSESAEVREVRANSDAARTQR